jgi:hypothetical protein
MSGRIGTKVLLGAALSLALTAPEPALAMCPDATVTQSAKVVEFETMMMVVKLSCSSVGVIMTDHYDSMLAARRAALEDAHNKVRRFLYTQDQPVGAKGPSVAPRSRRDDPYEHYLTRLGSSYGNFNNSLDRCQKFDQITVALADKTAPDTFLQRAADRLIETPFLHKMATCPNKP